VHYTQEFLCSLLNEQPMGFYPPDALVHEAQRRGVAVHPPDVNESGVECEIEPGSALPDLEVRVGLGYVRGVRAQDASDLVAARTRGGRFRGLSDLASRAGCGTAALELLAWSGACDSLALAEAEAEAGMGGAHGAQEAMARRLRPGFARRVALWQLGVVAPGRSVPGGTQLALPLDLPAPPSLRDLTEWEAMLADYGTTGLTTRAHPLALLRERMAPDTATSRDLEELEHGRRVRIGGLVVARQRPGTASGIVFLLLEDEYGTINLVVPPRIYERHRLVVRTEPLMLVTGKLEKLAAAGGAINVLVDWVGSIDAPDQIVAEIKDFSMLDEQVRRGLAEQRAAAAAGAGPGNPPAPGAAGGGEAEDFRAVAPPIMSFASGRRR
jgi:error-prone DNA polymerase